MQRLEHYAPRRDVCSRTAAILFGCSTALVTMLTSSNSMARENAAGALMHLALDPANQIAIAKAGGIAPLVTILNDGTEQAHKHAAEALGRLAVNNSENQTQEAKRA
jgi:vacuolar protein 8